MEHTTTAAERAERGVQQLASLMNYWLAPSSHDKLAAIIRWGFGESCGLDGGALSRIRNAKQSRGAGIKHLDAFAEANRALWMWHTSGPAAAIKEFGPHSSWDVKPEWLDEAIWLPRDDDPTQPLELGDLALLVTGRLELPYLGEQLLSPGKLTTMNRRLPELLEDLAEEQGWKLRTAVTRFLDAYPSKDPARVRKLRDLLSGGAELTTTELEMELAGFAEMIRSIRGLKSYTPAELQAELLSGRRRS